MKKIVVDTNVVFSAILNTESNIGDLVMNSDEVFSFYSAQYLRQEIDNHKDKLVEISKLSEEEIEESKYHVFSKINFLAEEQIPFSIWHQKFRWSTILNKLKWKIAAINPTLEEMRSIINEDFDKYDEVFKSLA